MPNWVMNELTCIFETSEEFQSFKNKVDEKNFYNSFLPMPEILVDTQSPHIAPGDFINAVNKSKGTNFLTLESIALSGDEWDAERAKSIIKNIKAFERTGYHDWHSWCMDNWGVKWDAVNCKSKELLHFNTIVYSFNSPWGTPKHFVEELSKLYPEAIFELVAGSIENDDHYEFTCRNGITELTCSYEDFRSAVMDGKWGGWDEWSEVFEEEEA